MVAIDGRDIDVLAAVVIVVGNGHAHSVHLHVQSAPGGDVRKRAVVIVAIESWEGFPSARCPVFAVDEQNVRPTVAVGVEEGYARAHGFGQVFLAGFSCVVVEFDSGGGGYVGEAD